MVESKVIRGSVGVELEVCARRVGFGLALVIALLASCHSPELQDDASRSADQRHTQAKDTIAEDSRSIRGKRHFVSGYQAVCGDGETNVVVEIPTGSVDKWEVDKTDGVLKWELRNETPRRVAYLGYPGNYGMIPRTVLPRENGGDGDPLDVIVLGAAVERGSIIKCKLIGVLRLLDGGEQDDKLIAVRRGTPFYDVDSIDGLGLQFPGVQDILHIWFANYKGPGAMEARGFSDRDAAQSLLSTAIDAYLESGQQHAVSPEVFAEH